MTTFKDYIITGSDLTKFINNFENFIKETFVEAWTIDKNDNIEDMFLIENEEEKASICLSYSDYKIKGKIQVVNIIPTDKHALSIDRYNEVLEKFNEQVIKLYKQKLGLNININLSDGEISLKEVFGKKAIKSLNDFFTDINNLSLVEIKDYSQTTDWFNFILYNYYEGTVCYSKEEVKNFFAEILQDGEKAEFLATEYERILLFLTYYEDEFKQNYRG